MAKNQRAGAMRKIRLRRKAAEDWRSAERQITRPEMTKKISTPTQPHQLIGSSAG